MTINFIRPQGNFYPSTNQAQNPFKAAPVQGSAFDPSILNPNNLQRFFAEMQQTLPTSQLGGGLTKDAVDAYTKVLQGVSDMAGETAAFAANASSSAEKAKYDQQKAEVDKRLNIAKALGDLFKSGNTSILEAFL